MTVEYNIATNGSNVRRNYIFKIVRTSVVKDCVLLSLATRESAFVYALASAAVVHTVADKCMHLENRLPYCGCNKNLKNSDLPVGEKWAGCSPDMNFTLKFVKEFLDRPVNKTERHGAFVLHNNRLGRLVSS